MQFEERSKTRDQNEGLGTLPLDFLNLTFKSANSSAVCGL